MNLEREESLRIPAVMLSFLSAVAERISVLPVLAPSFRVSTYPLGHPLIPFLARRMSAVGGDITWIRRLSDLHIVSDVPT